MSRRKVIFMFSTMLVCFINSSSAEQESEKFVGISREEIKNIIALAEQNLLTLKSANYSSRIEQNHETLSNGRPSIQTEDITISRNREGHLRFDVSSVVKFHGTNETMKIAPERLIIRNDIAVYDLPGNERRQIYDLDNNFVSMKKSYYSTRADICSNLLYIIQSIKEKINLISEATYKKGYLELGILWDQNDISPTRIITLDPNQGFLPIKIVAYRWKENFDINKTEEEPVKRTIEWQKKDDLWFPVSCTYDNPQTKEKVSLVSYTHDAIFDSDFFNPPDDKGEKLPERAKSSDLNKIAGIIKDKAGKPVPDAVVSTRGIYTRETTTNQDGRFSTTITGRDSFIKKQYLQIRHVERNLAAVIELKGDLTNLEITLSPGMIFSGKVVDVNGTGIQDAEITLNFMVMRGVYIGGGPESVEIDEKGHFEIKAIPIDYEYSVQAIAEGYGICSFAFPANDAINGYIESDPLVLLLADQTVSGVVVDVDDKPVAQAMVTTGFYPQPYRKTTTDVQGKFTIDRVCAGNITLQAEKNGANGRVSTISGVRDAKIILSKNFFGVDSEIEQPPSLAKKSLPDFTNIKLNVSPDQFKSKKILVCFWNIEQRPSRTCVLELSKKVKELNEKDIGIIAIHTANVEQEYLDKWLEENSIDFPVGMISENKEQIKFNWGVKALPWLILTDKNHIVVDEGFSINELEEKIKTLNK